MAKTVCIFAGARGKEYLFNDCRWIVSGLVKTGWDIMYGGSSKGIMGACCQQAKDDGGRIIGVLPERIAELKHYDPAIEIRVASDMAARKAHFWDCDAFVCLPGAYGTMDELMEVLTLTKLGYLKPPRPIAIFNQNQFYDPLVGLFSNMVSHGLMDENRAGLVKFCTTPWEVVDYINDQRQRLSQKILPEEQKKHLTKDAVSKVTVTIRDDGSTVSGTIEQAK
jgi:uncharacterized protein (TIGR00730 family)